MRRSPALLCTTMVQPAARYHGGPVGRRIGVGKATADGTLVPDHGIADRSGPFGQHGQVGLDNFRIHNFAVRSRATDNDFAILDFYFFQSRNAGNVHEFVGCTQAEFEGGNQAVATCQ